MRGVRVSQVVVIADFVTGEDKFKPVVEDGANFQYTEVAAASVTSVEQAIQFANQNQLFSEASGHNAYVFIAGATDGYLIVNPNDTAGNFDNGEDYVVVLQNHNTLASFGAGDIISI